jgi:hypothetical protein
MKLIIKTILIKIIIRKYYESNIINNFENSSSFYWNFDLFDYVIFKIKFSFC